jgi:predicted amidophosphoribosyltransferase
MFPGSRILYDAVQRVRHTPPQTGLDIDARRGNVSAAFALSRRFPAGIARVTLIDDVMTTGATVTACVRALREVVPDVDVFALARSVPAMLREGPF